MSRSRIFYWILARSHKIQLTATGYIKQFISRSDMASGKIDLNGLYMIGIYGDQIYRKKYDHMYLLFEGGVSILIKTNEILIEGGEVYEFTFNKEMDPNVFDLKEVFGIRTKIEAGHLIRRDEWYAPIQATNNLIGENPRSLSWAKPGKENLRNHSVKTVDCGLLLSGSDADVLIYKRLIIRDASKLLSIEGLEIAIWKRWIFFSRIRFIPSCIYAFMKLGVLMEMLVRTRQESEVP